VHIQLNPKTAGAHALLASIDFAKGAPEQGKADLQYEIAAHPGTISNHVALGTQLEKEQKWDEAKKAFEDAHAINPDAPMICAELAFLYLEHGGDINAGIALAETARKRLPGSPLTADALGWAYYIRRVSRTGHRQLEGGRVTKSRKPRFPISSGQGLRPGRTTRIREACLSCRPFTRPVISLRCSRQSGSGGSGERITRPVTLASRQAYALGMICVGLLLFPFKLYALTVWSDTNNSYLVAVPAMSVFVIWMGRRRIFECAGSSPFLGAVPFLFGVLPSSLTRARIVPASPDWRLPVSVMSVLLTWLGAFLTCFGIHATRRAAAALSLTLMMIPAPRTVMSRLILEMQHGSAAMSAFLFRLINVPALRDGNQFAPGAQHRDQ
jgi:hypothetical protein